MHHLPQTQDSAAANMATDQLLLEDYPEPEQPRFRHYAWSEAACTFGFAQAWSSELEFLSSQHAVIRRETGGGLVDHTRDWTWTLVLPLSHPVAAEGLTCLYSRVHQALHGALKEQEAPVRLQSEAPEPLMAGEFRKCFTRAERDDVILRDGGKVAGAAQRRTRSGILVQGYVDRPSLPGIDWGRLEADFTKALSSSLKSPCVKTVMPLMDSAKLSTLTGRFASEAWNHQRKRNR